MRIARGSEYELCIDINVLGTPDIQVGGAGPRLAPLERDCLLLLASRAGWVVSTDRLSHQLWDECPPLSARTRVQTLISALRRKLPTAPREAIATKAPGYVLNRHAIRMDLDHFEDRVAQARQARKRGHPAEASAAYGAALELWRGDPLDGVGRDSLASWALQLADLRFGIVEERVEVELELGRHAEVVADLRQLTASHPARERLHAFLMTALHRCGRNAEALASYRAAHDYLTKELGITPGTELSETQRTVLRCGADGRASCGHHGAAVDGTGDRAAPDPLSVPVSSGPVPVPLSAPVPVPPSAPVPLPPPTAPPSAPAAFEPLAPMPIPWGEMTIDPETCAVRFRGSNVDLSYDEFELLCLLSRSADRPTTMAELARELWSGQRTDALYAAENCLRRLRAKLRLYRQTSPGP